MADKFEVAATNSYELKYSQLSLKRARPTPGCKIAQNRLKSPKIAQDRLRSSVIAWERLKYITYKEISIT